MADRRALTLLAACLSAGLGLGQPALAGGPDNGLADLRDRLGTLDARLGQDPAARAMPPELLVKEAGLDAAVPPPGDTTGRSGAPASAVPVPEGWVSEAQPVAAATVEKDNPFAAFQAFGAPDAPRRAASAQMPTVKPLSALAAPGDARPKGGRGLEAQVANLRLPLSILSQNHGGKDNFDVIVAQGPRGEDVLQVRSGTVTLETLRALLARHGMQSAAARDATLRAPVVLWEDTVLKLGPADRVAMSRPDGAFILSFGRVEIDGSTLASKGGINVYAPDFRPFLTVAGGGSLSMSGAHVAGLGFGTTPKFSGVAVVAHPFMDALGPSRITDSLIEDAVTLSLVGSSGVEVTGSQFRDMRGAGILISRARDARITGNLFSGKAETNALRIHHRSDRSVVTDNVLLGGRRAGIVVSGGSRSVRVARNIVWRREGGGVKFTGTACGVIDANVILDNRQKGVEVRESTDTLLSRNLVGGSHGSGIWVSGQEPGAETFATDNRLADNASGVSSATGARIVLAGNDFTGQFLRLLDGDATPQTPHLVSDLRNRTPLVVTAGAVEPAERTAPTGCSQ